MVRRHMAVIGLGSNIAPEVHLPAAEAALRATFEVASVTAPRITPPQGYAEQPDFYNAALVMFTELDAATLKQKLRAIEAELGRVRGPIKSGPRTIDLDILLWDGEIMDDGVREYDFWPQLVEEALRKAQGTAA